MNEVNVALVPPRRRQLRTMLVILGLAAGWQGCEAGGGEAGYSPEECADACNKVAGASCGDVGASCFDSCVSYPNRPYEGDCQLELNGYLDCWWQADAYECDAEQRTQPVGCDTQRITYLACSDGGPGGTAAGGAAGNDGASAGATHAAGAGVGGATETEGAAGAPTGGMAGAGG